MPVSPVDPSSLIAASRIIQLAAAQDDIVAETDAIEAVHPGLRQYANAIIDAYDHWNLFKTAATCLHLSAVPHAIKHLTLVFIYLFVTMWQLLCLSIRVMWRTKYLSLPLAVLLFSLFYGNVLWDWQLPVIAPHLDRLCDTRTVISMPFCERNNTQDSMSIWNPAMIFNQTQVVASVIHEIEKGRVPEEIRQAHSLKTIEYETQIISSRIAEKMELYGNSSMASTHSESYHDQLRLVYEASANMASTFHLVFVAAEGEIQCIHIGASCSFQEAIYQRLPLGAQAHTARNQARLARVYRRMVNGMLLPMDENAKLLDEALRRAKTLKDALQTLRDHILSTKEKEWDEFKKPYLRLPYLLWRSDNSEFIRSAFKKQLGFLDDLQAFNKNSISTLALAGEKLRDVRAQLVIAAVQLDYVHGRYIFRESTEQLLQGIRKEIATIERYVIVKARDTVVWGKSRDEL